MLVDSLNWWGVAITWQKNFQITYFPGNPLEVTTNDAVLRSLLNPSNVRSLLNPSKVNFKNYVDLPHLSFRDLWPASWTFLQELMENSLYFLNSLTFGNVHLTPEMFIHWLAELIFLKLLWSTLMSWRFCGTSLVFAELLGNLLTIWEIARPFGSLPNTCKAPWWFGVMYVWVSLPVWSLYDFLVIPKVCLYRQRCLSGKSANIPALSELN